MKDKEKKETRGRKPVEDKKIAVHILPRKSEIDLLGGKDEVRRMCEAYIRDKAFIKEQTKKIF